MNHDIEHSCLFLCMADACAFICSTDIWKARTEVSPVKNQKKLTTREQDIYDQPF